ncbi:MAG: ATP-grasp domain-containing protein [Treponema sp.]|nr:ATP-grasp domain-containing protein [Candidatus Treponema equifaecale]
MMKKIMILGAGLMQKPAILAAKNLGYESVVVDGNPNAVSVPLADHFYPIDLKDKEALVQLADKINSESGEDGLAAVFTAGTDFSANVAYVAEHCGLPCHKYEACLNASDKVRMRGCFTRENVPSPDFQQIDSESLKTLSKEVEEDKVEFPKVVKPCDNMGGRGCRLVRSKEEFSIAVENAVKNSRTNRAIFEDYMEGAEFSIDSVVYNGTLTITGFADRHIFYPPYFIEMGHSLPTAIDSKMKNELIATFALGIKALGLTHGVAKADIKYTKNGPMIGEIAARLSGGYMSGWTYPYSSGQNLTEIAMNLALGQKPVKLLQDRVPLQWQPHKSVEGREMPFELYELRSLRYTAERAWISIPGKVSKIYGMDAVKTFAFVRDVLPRVKEGDTVDFPRNNVEKCGNILAVADSRQAAYDAAHKAVSAITIRLEPNNPQTDKFLAGLCEADEKGFPYSAFTFAPQNGNSSKIGSGTVIPANSPAKDCIPEILIPLADSLTDWNHCTLRQALEKFDKLCPEHRELDGGKFWSALLRGGIQGALYMADSNQ